MTGTRPHTGPAPRAREQDARAQVPAGARARGAAEAAPSVRLVRTGAELRALAGEARRAVVMTMGALHEGHAALVGAARERVGPEGSVVVTVFVNPLQFGPAEDLDRYPRTLDADLEVAAGAGADLVFAPALDEVYPGGEPQVRLAAGPMGERFEGASRPGHFDGMLTVVAKLLHLTDPGVAFFGQKDAQQLALIQRMVRDLNFPVEVVGVPTVREPDGLALSSRNRYLSVPERQTALALSRALFAARDAVREAAEHGTETGTERRAEDGTGGGAAPETALAAARAVLDPAARLDPPLALDYLALIDPESFTGIVPAERPAGHGSGPRPGSPESGAAESGAPDFTGEAVLAVAARVGATRLIDNVRLTLGARG